LDRAQEQLTAMAVHENSPGAGTPYGLTSLGWGNYHLSQVLVLNGRWSEAEQAARKSLEFWTSAGGRIALYYSALGHYRLGELLHRGDNDEEARSHFQQAKEVLEKISRELPDEPFCQTWLIVLLANCPDEKFRNPERAVGLARRGITETNGPRWRLLALSEYRSGAWQNAQASLNKSMELRSAGDAMDWLLAALVHWKLDERAQALEWYARAQNAISLGQPILYGDIGVLGFKRLVAEAADLGLAAAHQPPAAPESGR
jgi:tetratricopeptide (TPR) repeat protein